MQHLKKQLYGRNKKIDSEALQTIQGVHDTSVANHSQAHGREVPRREYAV